MITRSTIAITAPAELVWDVYADVERWSEWTASIDRITPLDGPELAIGRRFEIEQPRFPKLVWQVTALEPGRSWTWEQRSPGACTVAGHVVTPRGDGALVDQTLEQRGPIGLVVAVLTRRLTRRYLDLEAVGLTSRCEASHRADAAGT